jgi:2-keto-4-pentenoate hydratase/2-oxohepta-3-ene-1,7-dioic acid hydratase in catechol pathway
VVGGRRMRRVAAGAALDYVFGYTVCNDVSARDVQFSESQWTRGKSFDTFCPVGPVVVTADEIPDPQVLALGTRVRNFTLEPGDLLLTGTPWGCGYFMDPPRALEPGDLVECEIERIGVLRNGVAAAR